MDFPDFKREMFLVRKGEEEEKGRKIVGKAGQYRRFSASRIWGSVLRPTCRGICGNPINITGMGSFTW
jgi:hypothetical protein